MTVSELKAQLTILEQVGKGDVPVVLVNDNSGTLFDVLHCGSITCYPDTTRLTRGEYRGEGQNPDMSAGFITAVIIK